MVMMKLVMTKMMMMTIPASVECWLQTWHCSNAGHALTHLILMKILWGRSYYNPHFTVENKWGTEMLSNVLRSHSYGHRHHSPKISFFSLGTYPVDISQPLLQEKCPLDWVPADGTWEMCAISRLKLFRSRSAPLHALWPCNLPSEWRLCWGSGGWQSHRSKGHQWLPPIRNILGVSQRWKIKLNSV